MSRDWNTRISGLLIGVTLVQLYYGWDTHRWCEGLVFSSVVCFGFYKVGLLP